MIAIATINPSTPSETYVRQHIRKIAPGKTAVLYFEGQPEELKNMPSLKVDCSTQSRLAVRRYRSIYNLIKHSYPGAIIGYSAQQVSEFLIKHKVRSILAEFGPTGCALLPICLKLNIRLIVNFHGHDATVMPKRWIIRHAYRRLDKYAHAFVCGSNYFSGVLNDLGFRKEKIHVIPCGIEVGEFSFVKEKDPNLLIAVGRLTEKKAPHLTINAFSKVKKVFSSARLEIVGAGALMQKCMDLVNELRIADCVIFHGAKPHDFVKERLARAKVFLQHSVTAANGDTESQGISLLEAMASGVPVVSTRHNGFVETVIHGENGYLVKERDVTGMAESIIKILSDDKLREIMGRAGRKRVECFFNSDQQADKLGGLLDASN